MIKSIIFLILVLPLLILSCSSSNDDEINQLQSQEDLSVRKLFAIQNPIDTNIENCDSLFSNSKKIDAKDFFIELDDKLRDTHEIGKYSFVSFEGDIARNGPFSTWVYDVLIEFSKPSLYISRHLTLG